MSQFDAQYARQGGRCFWCQCFTLPQNLTREHLYPRIRRQREVQGSAYVLAHGDCNQSRGGIVLGSSRFFKWLKAFMRGASPEDARYIARRRRWRAHAEVWNSKG